MVEPIFELCCFTGIMPQLSVVKYDCVACGYILGPFIQREDEEVKPNICPSCQGRGPFELNVENVSIIRSLFSFAGHEGLHSNVRVPIQRHYIVGKGFVTACQCQEVVTIL